MAKLLYVFAVVAVTALVVHGNVPMFQCFIEEVIEYPVECTGQLERFSVDAMYSYNYLASSSPITRVDFEVQANSDVHIGLSAGPQDEPDMYEIVIGGWGNTQSVIRRSKQGVNEVVASTPGYLSPNEFRGFWISYDYSCGVIKVGRESFLEAFMEWTDPNPLPVNYIGYSTWTSSTGEFEFCVPTPAANNLVNVATTGTATQSSNYQGTIHADRAVDGNTNSAWSGGSYSSTNSNQNAWWKVDLGASYPVYEVIVTNRQDCCSGRLLNAEVRVGNSETISENTRCGELVGSDRVNDETLVFKCDGLVSGRYVSVQLVDRQDYLHVCEVQVMVPRHLTPDNLVNVATTGTASQSSNYQGTIHANRAIDGNTNSAVSGGSCSHTNNDQNAWLKVDLGKQYAVYEVIVTNRQDCCSGRILNAEVRVGNNGNIGSNTRCGALVGADRVNDKTLVFQCDGPVAGRYVSVQLVNRQDYLHVCEVQIMVPKYFNGMLSDRNISSG